MKILASTNNNKQVWNEIPNSVRACLCELPGISGSRSYTDVRSEYLNQQVDPDDLSEYMFERYLHAKREARLYFDNIMKRTEVLTDWMRANPLTYGELKYASSKAKREGAYRFDGNNDSYFQYVDELRKLSN